MKALLIIGAMFLVNLFSNATPLNLNSIKLVSNNNLPDLSQDKDFVKTAIEIYSIQARIIETNSTGLMRQVASGKLTDAEKNKLAVNLGYTDYAALNNTFNAIGKSIQDLKNKYTGLNDKAITGSLINTSVNKMAQDGKINVKSTWGVCFWQLICAIFNCIHNSDTCAELQACLCAAFAGYTACANNPPR
jgi:hypothetical protein